MTKQVIVWRHDLKVRKGKIAAQAAHASLAVFTRRITDFKLNSGKTISSIELTDDMREWLTEGSGFTKVCVSCEGEEELVALYNKAVEAGLPCSIITDSGRTEFNGVPTKTCIAIGPAQAEEIDKITGHLPLL